MYGIYLLKFHREETLYNTLVNVACFWSGELAAHHVNNVLLICWCITPMDQAQEWVLDVQSRQKHTELDCHSVVVEMDDHFFCHYPIGTDMTQLHRQPDKIKWSQMEVQKYCATSV